jgi:peptidoglycan hydrolase CwlO-like protein
MNILAALKQEEAKLQKQSDKVRQQLDAVRAAMKVLGSKVASRGKRIGKKKRVMSAAARARIGKATKSGGQSLERRRRRNIRASGKLS